MSICSNANCKETKPSVNGRCAACHALMSGALLRNRYQVERMVGKGGFGITYVVSDQDCFGEARILKELSPHPLENETSIPDKVKATAERLFRREAQVLLNLSHPGIPKLYAYFNEGNYSYLVEECIPGETLSELLVKQQRTLTEREVWSILMELADILEYLHAHQPPIIHRDIKPQNLMRHPKGHLLLIDFGAVYQAANIVTTNQTLIGSPGYAPNEQIFGQPVPQSDLYAAGATMLYMLTGIHPSKLFNSATKRMDWEMYVQVSPPLTKLLNELLMVNLEKRLESATRLKQRLREIESAIPPDRPATAAAEPAEKMRPANQKTPLVYDPDLHQQWFSKITTNVQSDFNQRTTGTMESSPEERGVLVEMPLPFLLRRIYREQLSGRLCCLREDIAKIVYFDQGAVVFAKSSLKSDRLGETLVRLGRITQEQFDQASQIMRERGVRFGFALVKLGAIQPDELKQHMSEQFTNIVYSLFNWQGGEYEIYREQPRKRSIKISLSTADIIFEGLRRMNDIELVKRWLGDFRWKLTLTTDPFLLYQSVNLNPKEAFIVSRIDKLMSVDEILSLGGLPEGETLKTICGLLAVGILEWADVDRRAHQSQMNMSQLLVEHQPLPADFDIQTAAAFCYEVEKMLENIENMHHYGILGLDRTASDKEINEAYTMLAKKFHPDRHAQLAKYNLSLRNELEKIFNKITEVYRELSDPSTRRNYDKKSRVSGSFKVTPELLRSAQQHVERAGDQIKVSLPLRAQVSSPDNLTKPPEQPADNPGELAAAADATDDKSELLAQALANTMKKDTGESTQIGEQLNTQIHAGLDTRLEPPANALAEEEPVNAGHEPEAAGPAAPVDDGQMAEQLFEQGLNSYNAGQFIEARDTFRAAIKLGPARAEYHIYLARSLTHIQGNSADAKIHFEKAIELEPTNSDYYAELGLFYQKFGLSRMALKMFDSALELDPDHPIARRISSREAQN